MKSLYLILTLFFYSFSVQANQSLKNYFPVNIRNSQSYTSLMMATYYGHKAAVKILLKHGANACLKDKRGHTAMMGAIVKAEWGIAKRLYKEDCKQVHSSGKTLAEFAAVFGQTEKLKSLMLDEKPSSFNHKIVANDKKYK